MSTMSGLFRGKASRDRTSIDHSTGIQIMVDGGAHRTSHPTGSFTGFNSKMQGQAPALGSARHCESREDIWMSGEPRVSPGRSQSSFTGTAEFQTEVDNVSAHHLFWPPPLDPMATGLDLSPLDPLVLPRVPVRAAVTVC